MTRVLDVATSAVDLVDPLGTVDQVGHNEPRVVAYVSTRLPPTPFEEDETLAAGGREGRVLVAEWVLPPVASTLATMRRGFAQEPAWYANARNVCWVCCVLWARVRTSSRLEAIWPQRTVFFGIPTT